MQPVHTHLSRVTFSILLALAAASHAGAASPPPAGVTKINAPNKPADGKVTGFTVTPLRAAPGQQIDVQVDGSGRCSDARRIAVEYRDPSYTSGNGVYSTVKVFDPQAPWPRKASFVADKQGKYLVHWLKPDSVQLVTSGDCVNYQPTAVVEAIVATSGLTVPTPDKPRQALGDLGMPAIQSAYLNIFTNSGGGTPVAGHAPVVYVQKSDTRAIVVVPTLIHADKMVCSFTIDVSNGAKSAQMTSFSVSQPDVYPLIQQQLGWVAGDYKIKVKATAQNTFQNQGLPPCLGQQELTLTVKDALPGQIQGLLKPVQLWPMIENPIEFNPKIVGNPCVYRVQLQKDGVTKWQSPLMTHLPYVPDTLDVQAKTSPADSEQYQKFPAAYTAEFPFTLLIRAAPNDGGKVSGCMGEYRDDNFKLPMITAKAYGLM